MRGSLADRRRSGRRRHGRKATPLAGVRQSRDLKHYSLNQKHGKQEGNKGNSPREFTRPGKARCRRASRDGGRRFPARVQRCLGQSRDRGTEGKVHLRLRDHAAELGKQSLMAPDEHRALTATAGSLAICKVSGERGSGVWEGEMNAGQRCGLEHGSKGARHGENMGEWERGRLGLRFQQGEREGAGRRLGEEGPDRWAPPVSCQRGRGGREGESAGPSPRRGAARGGGGVSGPRPKGGRGEGIPFLFFNIFSKCISFSSNIFLHKIFWFLKQSSHKINAPACMQQNISLNLY